MRVNVDLIDRKPPAYIAVEGPIGVGKTTLARRLAQTFSYEIVLERSDENPFLERFYRNRSQYALATQLFFLFQRAQQLEKLRQADLFEPVRVADFLLDKDRLFAEVTLDQDEFRLYNQVYDRIVLSAPIPDLVIYLQAPVDVLLRRIQQRGISYEQLIDTAYLETLNEAYSSFFHYFDASPLLIVNAATIDFAANDNHYSELLDAILDTRSGRHYFNRSFLQ